MAIAPVKAVVIFMHLPKSAGSTLARIIERQYASASTLRLYESAFGEELASLPSDQLAMLRAVTGHFYFGVHNHLAKTCTYVTVLRDPIDRVISHYHFVRRLPSHYLYNVARKMSLREYVECCGKQEPNNDQTRLLAGKCDGTPFGLCSNEMLEIAKRNLERHFAVVGVVEEFDRCLLLMKRILGWQSPFYTSENVSPRRTRKEELSPDVLQVIQAHNTLDVELYRYASCRFWEQIQRQDNSFEVEVRRFRKLNGVYGRLHRLASTMRNGIHLSGSAGVSDR